MCRRSEGHIVRRSNQSDGADQRRRRPVSPVPERYADRSGPCADETPMAFIVATTLAADKSEEGGTTLSDDKPTDRSEVGDIRTINSKYKQTFRRES